MVGEVRGGQGPIEWAREDHSGSLRLLEVPRELLGFKQGQGVLFSNVDT